MGPAGPDRSEGANELDAEAQAHLVLHTVDLWSAGLEGERHGIMALHLFEQLGDLAAKLTR